MRNHWLRWTSWRSPGTDLAACVSRVSPLITHLVIWTCSSGFWILLVCWCKKSVGLLSSVAFWTSQGRVQEFKKLRAIFISLQTEKSTIQELFIKIITDYILDSDKTGIPFCLPLTSLPSFWSFSQKSCCTCLYSSLLNTGNHRHTKVKQLRLIKGSETMSTLLQHDCMKIKVHSSPVQRITLDIWTGPEFPSPLAFLFFFCLCRFSFFPFCSNKYEISIYCTTKTYFKVRNSNPLGYLFVVFLLFRFLRLLSGFTVGV